MITINKTKPTVAELTNLVASSEEIKHRKEYKKMQQEIYQLLRESASQGKKIAEISYTSNNEKNLIIELINNEFPTLKTTIHEDNSVSYDPHDNGCDYISISGW